MLTIGWEASISWKLNLTVKILTRHQNKHASHQNKHKNKNWFIIKTKVKRTIGNSDDVIGVFNDQSGQWRRRLIGFYGERLQENQTTNVYVRSTSIFLGLHGIKKIFLFWKIKQVSRANNQWLMYLFEYPKIPLAIQNTNFTKFQEYKLKFVLNTNVKDIT